MDTQPSLDELLAKIKANLPALKDKFHIETLDIFGSFLRGEEKEGSDLDLLVTFSETPGLFTFDSTAISVVQIEISGWN